MKKDLIVFIICSILYLAVFDYATEFVISRPAGNLWAFTVIILLGIMTVMLLVMFIRIIINLLKL